MNKEHSISRLLKIKQFKQDHLDGDPLAVDKCVVFCTKRGIQLPPFAKIEIFKRSAVNLGMIEKPATKYGRHSNPHVRWDDIQTARIVLSAIHACELFGLKGEKKLEKARELLNKDYFPKNKPISLSTLEQSKKRAKRKNIKADLNEVWIFLGYLHTGQ